MVNTCDKTWNGRWLKSFYYKAVVFGKKAIMTGSKNQVTMIEITKGITQRSVAYDET